MQPSIIAGPRVFRTLAAVVAACATAIGIVALVGWATGFGLLATVFPDLVSMKPNTSLCIIALAVALIGVAVWPSKKIATAAARALALAAFAVAVLTIAEYIFGWKLGIDQALFRDVSILGPPGRMGLNTAIAIALLGIAVVDVASESDRAIRQAHLATLGAAAIAVTTAVGYLYSATYLFQVQSSTPMAINTAIAIALLCGALFWAKPDRGFMAFIHSADAAGLMLRWLIPAAVAVPVVLGWLPLMGQRYHLYDTTYGVALLVLSMVTILVALIVVNSQGVRALEATRARAQADLEAALASVERCVEERTSELSDALAKLADSERRFDLATEGSNTGILDLDIAADKLYCPRAGLKCWAAAAAPRFGPPISRSSCIPTTANQRESCSSPISKASPIFRPRCACGTPTARIIGC